ncbi:MAG: sugar phosphate isomerase/epimerase [Candidatus Sumerlaeota bacterium]|nr:sugar phosphate isomerase/epimerase [Candidatus Sumerlaeota bacterium]
MKLSMMSYTIARQAAAFSLRGMLELTRELNLEAIDFVGLHGAEPKELRRMIDDFGIRCVCHTFFVDLNHDTPAARRPGVEAVKRGVEAAVVLGADKVMIPTANKTGAPREQARRNYMDGLNDCAEFARPAGVTLTVENFPGPGSPFVVSDDVLEGVRKVPGLKITFDSGNVLTGGEDPGESFRRCAEHVVHAHFKDWRRAPEGGKGILTGLDGKHYKAALIGEGIVDHAAVLRAMRQGGYRGYINIEYEGDDYSAAEAVRRAARLLDGLIGEGAACDSRE